LQHAYLAEKFTLLAAFDLAFYTACLKPFAASGVKDPLLVADSFFTCVVHCVVLGLLGNPVYRVGRLLKLWLGKQALELLCIVLVGVEQPIQPTVQQASRLAVSSSLS